MIEGNNCITSNRDKLSNMFNIMGWGTLLAEPFLNSMREKKDSAEIESSLYWACTCWCLDTITSPGGIVWPQTGVCHQSQLPPNLWNLYCRRRQTMNFGNQSQDMSSPICRTPEETSGVLTSSNNIRWLPVCFVLLYNRLSFDVRLINKISACREKKVWRQKLNQID